MRVAVTGASGFLGGALLSALAEEGRWSCTAVTRCARERTLANVTWVSLGDLDGVRVPSDLFADTNAVIHTAAITAAPATISDRSHLFRVNVDGTLALARQAARQRVRRFVFISSIKVNGEETAAGRVFTSRDKPAPQGPYAHSKLEAERALRTLANQTGLELVILRPSLVYGPGAVGNFARLVAWVRRGVPLPFGAVHNRRSMTALQNLVHLIMTSLDRPQAANRTFLVGDREELSTSQLLEHVGDALGRRARLIRVPPSMIFAAASLIGKSDLARKLLSSMQLDTQETSELLQWSQPVTTAEAIRRAVRHSMRDESQSASHAITTPRTSKRLPNERQIT